MPNDAAVRRLLRNHPKLHPRSAAAELKALGLAKLPILEWELEQPWGQFVALSPETGVKTEPEVIQQPFQMPSAAKVPPIFGFPGSQPLEAPISLASPAAPAVPAAPETAGPGAETVRLAELEIEEKAVLQEVLALDRGGRDNILVPQPPREAPTHSGRRRRPHEEEQSDSPAAPPVPKVTPPKHGGRAPPRPPRVR
ncbi:Bifunctional arginine demethylase and lysyl-hydroxylase PSR [Durusdinium trenchii]|uniref:Bifunctional arginine demethylase and lysyl-hydroxylase PSR n=1 Tax=Durusdinium trenchii TaxID=1381693 RepID=A0ABP0RPZ5_9DINO